MPLFLTFILLFLLLLFSSQDNVGVKTKGFGIELLGLQPQLTSFVSLLALRICFLSVRWEDTSIYSSALKIKWDNAFKMLNRLTHTKSFVFVIIVLFHAEL